MSKVAVLVGSILFAVNAFAANQLDIIGLVPGVSTKTQVEQAKSEYGYVIGGYELICIPEFIDGLLSQFLCVTGEDSHSRDKTANSYRIASNNEVHVALVKGFTKKFGSPSKFENSSVSNRMGAEFQRNIAVWIDKKGNKLTLINMANKIDEGMVLLESAQQLRKDQAESRNADAQRNF